MSSFYLSMDTVNGNMGHGNNGNAGILFFFFFFSSRNVSLYDDLNGYSWKRADGQTQSSVRWSGACVCERVLLSLLFCVYARARAPLSSDTVPFFLVKDIKPAAIALAGLCFTTSTIFLRFRFRFLFLIISFFL